ncbi:hypothetical protein Tco_1207400, partial [Tanacetum coccineum]
MVSCSCLRLYPGGRGFDSCRRVYPLHATSADTWHHVACHVADPDPTRFRPDQDLAHQLTGCQPPLTGGPAMVRWWSAAVDRCRPPLTEGPVVWQVRGTRYKVAGRGVSSRYEVMFQVVAGQSERDTWHLACVST